MGEFYSCASGEVIAGGMFTGVAGTGITITDTVYQRIYQRIGTSKAISVSGTYAGSPSRILGRAVPAGSSLSASAVTYPWQTIIDNPTGGSYSGSVTVPQGDGWVIQVRDGVNTLLGATGTHAFGVGAFIAMLGQSNMEYLFSVPWQGSPTGHPSALGQTAISSLQRIGTIKDSVQPSTLASTYGTYDSYGAVGDPSMHGLGIVYMANALVAGLGCPVGMLLRAVSGSSSSQWLSGQSCMNDFLVGLDAVGGDCEAVIWLQGETDAQNGVSYATYLSNLQNIFNTINTHTGRSVLPFGVVIVGPATSGWAASENLMQSIRKAQIDFVVANAASGAFIAGTDIDGDLAGGTVHINETSQLTQGARYTEAIKRRFSGATYGIEGPVISSATRSGTVITVNVTQYGGTALVGTGQQAFRVFDGGSPVTINSAAVVGNSITLTLNSTPSGTVTLDYAMANAPFGATTTSDEVCYDNQIIPGSSVGLPLQPKYLINVS